ncbi:NAD(P)/FAD-dependent oxidoreductase [Muriicola marianensis]|uniref:FAD-dependent oxidoreductase n=1 Tax=Muriicola marianensis TaxID=1324801 RepID=A0ABQ1QZU2_9FLAO|nr:FAD-dependent oxidoreductase [Muriicola marianensis]GGD50948.1 FAD-dependent oxidoreductase [Muriicola marianensis]
MNLSHWEYDTWFKEIDFTIVGSGIVGLSCALELRRKFPDSKILIIEKGILPQGASTKNAGFACFGSISEVLDDLRTHTPEEVAELVRKRWEGIQLLRATVGDRAMDYQQLGGHELFLKKDHELFLECEAALERINTLLQPVFGQPAFKLNPNTFGFQGIEASVITNELEGQIHTGMMMNALLSKAQASGIHLLNATEVLDFEEYDGAVRVYLRGMDFTTNKLLIATNGFAGRWTEDVRPARAQVLVTKPIPGLKIKGTFHLDKGYYYFRNAGDRILLGGGRNLDFKGEETEEFGLTDKIQDQLHTLLKEVILPGIPFEVDRRWSGIMGTGPLKKPIVLKRSDRVAFGVRLGGMGIAIGSSVGKELAGLVQAS